MRLMPRFSLFCLSTILLAGHTIAGDITVSAASSLTEAMKEVARTFEQREPAIHVKLNFAASGVLLQQISHGAPVDVFASADIETMDEAQKQSLVCPASIKPFASNTLVLVQPISSKNGLTQLAQLIDPVITRVAIGNPGSVPVGHYAVDALTQAKLWPALKAKSVMTLNVRQSLDYVARGEADAGFVYATDARSAADKVRVSFKVATMRPIRYPVALTRQACDASDARRFEDFLLSVDGQAILARYGFTQP
ncbi:molybdate ABC transporter substrate-binding protein [Burkholderiaceae bacterium DAT-1]|nr:molybdate ABC transporter substrate-binding protein [Burkholderiaceae bacterium DAT-1]